MNLGKYNKVTVQDFYNYCVNHHILHLEVTVALNLFNREAISGVLHANNAVNPVKEENATDFFGESIEYTTEDVMKLFNS